MWEERGNFDEVFLRSAYYRIDPRRRVYPNIDGKGSDVVGESLVVPRTCIGREDRGRQYARASQLDFGSRGAISRIRVRGVAEFEETAGLISTMHPTDRIPGTGVGIQSRRLEICQRWYKCRHSTLCKSLSARCVGLWCRNTSGERLVCTNGDGIETRQAANDHLFRTFRRLAETRARNCRRAS